MSAEHHERNADGHRKQNPVVHPDDIVAVLGDSRQKTDLPGLGPAENLGPRLRRDQRGPERREARPDRVQAYAHADCISVTLSQAFGASGHPAPPSNPPRPDNRRRGETLTNEKFSPPSRPQSRSAPAPGERGAFFANTNAERRPAFGRADNFVLGGPLRRPQYGMRPPGLRLPRASRRLVGDALWMMSGANRRGR